MIDHMKSRVFRGLLALSLCGLLVTTATAFEIKSMRIAVLQFVANDDSITVGQGVVLGDLLTAEFQASGEYEVVERMQLDNVLHEFALQGSGSIDQSTAVSVGRMVSARIVVIGTLSEDGAHKMALGRFVDVEKGSVLFAKTVSVESGSMDIAAHEIMTAFVAAEHEEASREFERAVQLAGLGQTESSMNLFSTVLGRYPNTPVADDVLLTLARAHLSMGAYFDAADHAESLLDNFTDSPLTEDALFVLAESMFFTVYGDPDRPVDPGIFTQEWLRRESHERESGPRERIRTKTRLSQKARQKYELLLSAFPGTRYANTINQRLARIAGHGGH